jgi:RNA recognition motif-containing protein
LTKPDFCRLPTETCIETNFAQFFDSSTKMQAESRDAASDSESQDTRGIKRKLEAENENKDPKLIRDKRERTVFIGRMKRDVTEDEVREFFKDCGTIERVKLLSFKDTGKGAGAAFVRFESVEGAELV